MLQFPFAQAAVWRFDLPSFVIGIVAGLLIAGLLFLFRSPLREGVDQARAKLRALRDRLSAGAERRYLDALRDRLPELHVGELAAPFADVYLPPRFASPAPRPSLTLDARAPRSLTLHQALASTSRLVVLGESGSGRTALLLYLARVYLERTALDDLRLDEDRLPILVHLAEIDWSIEADDPALPLVEAAILHAPKLVAANLTALLRSEFNGKRLAVLIDGWDELPESDREAAQAWLSALVTRYPGHRYVVAARPSDAAGLSQSSFACLSLAPLWACGIRALADRWAAAAEGGERDAAMLTESMRQPPGVPPRPLDITLAVSVWRKRGSMPLSLVAAYDRWIEMALADSGVQDVTAARTVLSRLAWNLLDQERLITTLDETAQLAAETIPAEPGKPPKTVAEIAETLARGSAVLIPLGRGIAFAHPRIAAYLAASHAHETGQAMALATRLDDPSWQDVSAFFAAIGDATPLVNAMLARPDDLFHTQLIRAGQWAALAPATATWRGKVMNDLAKAMMTQTTPEPLRYDLMRVLVSTRDKGLAFLFRQALARPEPHFKKLGAAGFGLMRREADAAIVAPAMSEADAEVRHAALRALGELGGQAAVDSLAQALLELDDDGRRAAAEALATCGKPGWELLKEGALMPDDQGEDVLRVRRASAYGLARVGQEWAREILIKLERDDKQWFVRSGATEALKLMDEESGEGEPIDLSPLDRDNLGWLIQWSASKGQPIGLGRSAVHALERGLGDLDPAVRLAAIHTYTHLGDPESIPLLRERLKDENAAIRHAAFEALRQLALRSRAVVPQ